MKSMKRKKSCCKISSISLNPKRSHNCTQVCSFLYQLIINKKKKTIYLSKRAFSTTAWNTALNSLKTLNWRSFFSPKATKGISKANLMTKKIQPHASWNHDSHNLSFSILINFYESSFL